jgi:group I intron endonuclease
MIIVYQITCVPTGKSYIGVTRKTLEQRWTEHYKEARATRFDTVFYRAMRLHGHENFSIKVLRQVDSHDEAQRLERRLIAEMKTFAPDGLNTSTGGESWAGIARHPDVARKISISKTGHKMSDAHRKAQSARLKGVKRPAAATAAMIAKNQCPVRRAEISAQSKALWTNPEYRAARVQQMVERNATPELKALRLAGIQRAKAAGKYRDWRKSGQSIEVVK